MATYWVPDLHDIKGFSDHLKHSTLFIANGANKNTLPGLARIKKSRWEPIELNDQHLRSHGKIADCEWPSLLSESFDHLSMTKLASDIIFSFYFWLIATFYFRLSIPNITSSSYFCVGPRNVQKKKRKHY